ncbi:hypothetical protein OH492_11935 [Vibrio chagasii]|nr:hypothetical protein [Vibrio chagasii]
MENGSTALPVLEGVDIKSVLGSGEEGLLKINMKTHSKRTVEQYQKMLSNGYAAKKTTLQQSLYRSGGLTSQ